MRDPLGRWLHARIDAVSTASVRRELRGKPMPAHEPHHVGPSERLHIAAGAAVGNVLLDTTSGSISIADGACLGHEVALLTGALDARALSAERAATTAENEHDIVIETGALLASRAIIVGPCRIGAGAVVRAGAVVDADVPRGAIVAGAPAEIVGWVEASDPLPPAVRVMTDVGTLWAHAQDEVITPFLQALGRWEEDDRRLLEAALEPGALAVDVGANIGYMTLAAARAVGAGGRVIAIEPHPLNLALLRANIAANGVASRVQVIEAAAWDSPGTVDLAECEQNMGDHRVETLARERSTLPVDAVRLDDVLDSARRVAVIKLDVQASERRVIAGATSLLRRDRPVVLCEYWPQGIRARGEDPLELLADARALGYEITLPDDDAAAQLDDEALTASVHARSSLGGFATLLMRASAR